MDGSHQNRFKVECCVAAIRGPRATRLRFLFFAIHWVLEKLEARVFGAAPPVATLRMTLSVDGQERTRQEQPCSVGHGIKIDVHLAHAQIVEVLRTHARRAEVN